MTIPATDDEPGEFKMTTADEAALLASVERMRQSKNAARREQIEQKLAAVVTEDDWFKAAWFASYYCQTISLDLPPSRVPPCWINESEIAAALSAPSDVQGQRTAAQLLMRMKAANVSKYVPDPMTALAAAEASPEAAAKQVIDNAIARARR